MDEAPYHTEAFSPITGCGFRVVSRQDGQAGRAGLCSRSPAEPARSASTAQVSGVEIPGRPSWRATARTCAQGARWRNQPSTCGVTAVPRSWRDDALSA